MFWFMLVPFIAVVYATLNYRAQVPRIRERADFYGPLIGTTIIGVIVAACLCFAGDILLDDQVIATKSYELANLADGSGVTGSFFLGSGSIGSTQYFGYYANNGDGSYSLDKQPAFLSKVRFTDDTPRIQIDTVNGGSYWFAPWANHSERYTFYVPKGSIDNHFVLDAK